MPGPLTWSGCGCVNHNYIESCRWKGILPLAALYVDTREKGQKSDASLPAGGFLNLGPGRSEAKTWEHVVRSNSV